MSQYRKQVSCPTVFLCSYEYFDATFIRKYSLTLEPLNRFDVEGDEETQLNFTPPEHVEIPNIIPSPPHQEELPKCKEIMSIFSNQI